MYLHHKFHFGVFIFILQILLIFLYEVGGHHRKCKC